MLKSASQGQRVTFLQLFGILPQGSIVCVCVCMYFLSCQRLETFCAGDRGSNAHTHRFPREISILEPRIGSLLRAVIDSGSMPRQPPDPALQTGGELLFAQGWTLILGDQLRADIFLSLSG